jgi:hypothetical protein
MPVQGVQRNVPPFLLDQCRICHDQPYSFATTSTDIERCKSMGNFIAVAASNTAVGDTLHVVAGLFSSDLQQTSDIYRGAGPKNGAYWHYVPDRGFGFSGDEQIYLNYADIEDYNCNNRLSWHLDRQGWGGWRAGCNTLVEDATWRKLIYACDVFEATQVIWGFCACLMHTYKYRGLNETFTVLCVENQVTTSDNFLERNVLLYLRRVYQPWSLIAVRKKGI